MTSGTIPDARFPSQLPALDGSNLTDVNAPTVTVTDESVDTTNFVLFSNASSGERAIKSSQKMTYNSVIGRMDASVISSVNLDTGANNIYGFFSRQTFIVDGATNANNTYPTSFKSSPINNTGSTVGNFVHFAAQNFTNNTNSFLTRQRVFDANANLTDKASNTYGISSRIGVGTLTNYNIHASGLAPNYFAGDVGIGRAVPRISSSSDFIVSSSYLW